MAQVLLENVTKNYGKLEVVHGINLDIAHNEFVVLVGPSGCGKSTTLRMIAGLEEISAGDISIGGQIVNDMPPRDRNISMVFQNYALYPHMTVRENLGFSLQIAGKPPAEIARAVGEAAGILSLDDYLDRKPSELSGGQRQRVAMGRAIVRHPDVFLFDEPLSNLDAKLRAQMRVEIKKLHQKIQTTVIYVTHDQVEAMTMADRIVVLRDGRIEQIGTPHELYFTPANQFVATFIGAPQMNLVPCQLVTNEGHKSTTVQVGKNDEFVLPIGSLGATNVALTLGFRPENVLFDEPEGQAVKLKLEMDVIEHLGASTNIYGQIRLLGGVEADVTVSTQAYAAFQEGKSLDIWVAVENCHLFAIDGTSLHRNIVPQPWN